jgi:hypothetical protein
MKEQHLDDIRTYPALGPEGIVIFVISRAEVLLDLERILPRHVGGVIHS